MEMPSSKRKGNTHRPMAWKLARTPARPTCHSMPPNSARPPRNTRTPSTLEIRRRRCPKPCLRIQKSRGTHQATIAIPMPGVKFLGAQNWKRMRAIHGQQTFIRLVQEQLVSIFVGANLLQKFRTIHLGVEPTRPTSQLHEGTHARIKLLYTQQTGSI